MTLELDGVFYKEITVTDLEEFPKKVSSNTVIHYKEWSLGVGNIDKNIEEIVARTMKQSFFVMELNKEEETKNEN